MELVLILEFQALAFKLVYRQILLLLQLVEFFSGLHNLIETPDEVLAVEEVYLLPERSGKGPDAELQFHFPWSAKY